MYKNVSAANYENVGTIRGYGVVKYFTSLSNNINVRAIIENNIE